MSHPARNASAPELPEQFGRYRILAKLGQGGMGAVYKAHDTQLDRVVALKVPAFINPDGEILTRFLREARAAATLQHPNVCPVYDVGQEGGIHYLTMAFIEGQPLDWRGADGRPRPVRATAALVRKLALALHEAHAKGIVHRDIKPANILVNRGGEPILMDFGLAVRVNAATNRITQDGTLLGTVGYMAPEQVEGNPDAIGPACDVYALGVVLYELLTGRLPFEGNPITVVAAIVTRAAPPPTEFRSDLPPKLVAVCTEALKKDPAERCPSMAAFAAALAEYLRETMPAGGSGPVPRLPAPAADDIHTRPTVAPKPPPTPAPAPAAAPTSNLRASMFGGGRSIFQIARRPPARPAADPARGKAREKEPRKPRKRKLPGWVWGVGGAAVAALAIFIGLALFHQGPAPDGTLVLNFSGRAPAGLTVHIDGNLIADWQQPIPLAVGEHRISFRTGGNPPVTYNVKIQSGTATPLAVSLPGLNAPTVASRPPAPTAEPPRPPPTSPAPAPGLVPSAPAFTVQVQPETVQLAQGVPGQQIQIKVRDTDASRPTFVRFEGLPQGVVVRTRTITKTAEGYQVPANSSNVVLVLAALPEAAVAETEVTVTAVNGTHTAKQTFKVAVQSGFLVRSLPLADKHPEAIRAIAFSPDGQFALAGGGGTLVNGDWQPGTDYGLHVWSVTEGKQVKVLKGHAHQIRGAWWDLAGQAAISTDRESEVVLWNVGAGRPDQARVDLLTAVAFLPDARKVLLAGGNVIGVYFPTSTRAPIKMDRWHHAHVHCLAASRDGKLAVSGDDTGKALLWDPTNPTARPPKPLEGHKEIVLAAAFSPDGKRLATAGGGLWQNNVHQRGNDHAVRVWDVSDPQKPQLLHTLIGHQAPVAAVDWAPDGKRLVSGANDGWVRCWDAAAGKELRRFAGHRGAVLAVRVQPGGDQVVSGSADKSILTWKLPGE
jgi:hypothetical protein